MDLEERILELEQQVEMLITRRVGKTDIIPGSILQPHLGANCALIILDVSTNRPTSGNNYIRAFLATDTNVLSLWNGSAWKSVTLS